MTVPGTMLYQTSGAAARESGLCAPATQRFALTPALLALAAGVILLAPLRWFTVLSAGGVGLEPVHLALVIFAAAFVMSPGRLTLGWVVLAEIPAFWLASMGYLLTSLVVLVPYGVSESVVNILPQVLYIPAFFLLCVTIAGALLENRTRTLYRAAGLAILLTFATLWVSALLAGLDPAAAILRLFGGGTIYTFNRTFTSAVFNYANRAAGAADAEYATSIVNELVSCLVVLYALMRAMRPAAVAPGDRLLELAAGVALWFLALITFSRSGLLACALTFAGAAILGLASGRLRSIGAYATLGLTVLAGLVGAWLLLSSSDVVQRVLLDPTSADERLELFGTSLGVIDEYPLLGTAGRFPGKGTPDIHNLFLGTWVKGGLIPLGLILVAYLSVLGYAIRYAVRGVLRVDDWWKLRCPFEWAMMLPVVVLLRVFLSGKGGTFSISMWLSAATFLAFVAANEIARRSGAARSGSDTRG